MGTADCELFAARSGRFLNLKKHSLKREKKEILAKCLGRAAFENLHNTTGQYDNVKKCKFSSTGKRLA